MNTKYSMHNNLQKTVIPRINIASHENEEGSRSQTQIKNLPTQLVRLSSQLPLLTTALYCLYKLQLLFSWCVSVVAWMLS